MKTSKGEKIDDAFKFPWQHSRFPRIQTVDSFFSFFDFGFCKNQNYNVFLSNVLSLGHYIFTSNS